jgi:tellurite resistance protein TerC
LFVVLLLVESTDLVFAVDSIPAVLAISQDPLIVYTSNIFAIMGLRSIFFALAGIIQLFHYLQYGLSIILVFVGTKMVLSNVYKIPVGIALGVVAGILAVSVLVSVLWPPKKLEASPVEVNPSGRDESDQGS